MGKVDNVQGATSLAVGWGVGWTQGVDAALNGVSYAASPGANAGNVAGTIGACIAASFAIATYGEQKFKLHKDELPINPMLEQKYEGHAWGPSTATKRYLVGRLNKNLAGGLSSAAGGVAATATQVNVAVPKNISSAATTGKHLSKLETLSKTLSTLAEESVGHNMRMVVSALNVVIKMKQFKLGTRIAASLADLTPAMVPAAGAIIGGVGATVAWAASLNYAQWCEVAAKIIHFASYEYVHGEGGGGDALDPYTVGYTIAEELLTQRGISRLANKRGLNKIFGKRAAVSEYMIEPAGWLVLHDKISAM